MNLLKQAETLASKRFRIFPLVPNTKKPYPGTRGLKEATYDLKVIRQWWENTPDAEIGIATGQGLLVIDYDNDGDVFETIDGFCEKYDIHPDDTFSVETPSGGYHVYLRHDPNTQTKNSASKLFPNVDIRGDGGYVKYYDMPTNDLASCPQEFLDCVSRRSAEPSVDGCRATNPKSLSRETERDTAEMRMNSGRTLEANITAARQYALNSTEVPHGQRDTAAYQMANDVADFGLTMDQVENIMHEWNELLVLPPLDGEQLQKCIESAFRNSDRAKQGMNGVATRGVTMFERHHVSDNSENILGTRKLWSRTDLETYPKPVWLIDGFIEDGTIAQFYGKMGSYKSYLGLTLAQHLAHGIDWEGCKIKEPRQVLYMAAEGAAGLLGRIKAW